MSEKNSQGRMCFCGHTEFVHYKPTRYKSNNYKYREHCLSCDCKHFTEADVPTPPRQGEQELLACPCCGGDRIRLNKGQGLYDRECDDCGIQTRCYERVEQANAAWNRRPAPSIDAETLAAPIDLILFCPACGQQHIDKAEPDVCELCGHHRANHFIGDCSENDGCADCVSNGAFMPCSGFTAWLNPPHKSHRCHGCNHVWRPADVPTNGVSAIKTKGSNDSKPLLDRYCITPKESLK